MPPENVSRGTGSDSQESLSSLDSQSTNATLPDLPGAGRTIGLFYDRAGQALEARLNSLAARIRRGDSEHQVPQSIALRRRTSISTTFSLDPRWTESTYSLSTNATAPNLPGAGRLLGKLYDAGGRSLESRLNRVATKAGFGPDACLQRIRSMMSDDRFKHSTRLALAAHRNPKNLLDLLEKKERLIRECNELIGYAK